MNFTRFKIRFQIYFRILFVYIIVFSILLTIGIITGKFLETLTCLISYCVFRKNGSFNKELHMETTTKCLHITLIIFVSTIILLLPASVSLIFSTLFGFIINLLMYIIKEFVDLIKTKVIKLYKGMSKDDFNNYIKDKDFTELEIRRLKLRYVKKKTYQEIADIECVELSAINKFFQRLKKKL